MKSTSHKTLLTLGLLAASLLPAAAADPNADQLLHQMSAKLAAAKTFSFEATREIDPELIPGRALPEKAKVTVSVQRPNKIAGRGVSKAGIRRFIADGRTLTIVDEKKNLYATVPMRKSIDGLVEEVDAKYGFTPPLAEFALSDPYAEFHRQAHTVSYAGRERLSRCWLGCGGVECDRLSLKGKEADAELWISTTDHLPRKLVATFHRAGRPQVRIEFHRWNLAAPVTAADFTFTPPKGAEKIEMMTTAKMQAARKH